MTPSRMRLGGHHAFFHHTMSECGQGADSPTKLKVLPSEKSKVTLFTSCGWLDRATVSYNDYLCARAHFRPVWSMLEEVLDERRNVLRRVSWRWRSARGLVEVGRMTGCWGRFCSSAGWFGRFCSRLSLLESWWLGRFWSRAGWLGHLCRGRRQGTSPGDGLARHRMIATRERSARDTLRGGRGAHRWGVDFSVCAIL